MQPFMRLKLKDKIADAPESWRQTNQNSSQADRFLRLINQPLVLISQVKRSGGSLMAQLFDNHPEILAHPHEFKIGYPNKYTCPAINIRMHPRENYGLLMESQKNLENGYNKSIVGGSGMRFYLPPVMQITLFS